MRKRLEEIKTKVINVTTGEEVVCKSRNEASKFTGIDRKHITTYMNRNLAYKQTYKFLDIK